jgi:CRP/FNR family transcriptional regulator, cyclic AMP receptor protein
VVNAADLAFLRELSLFAGLRDEVTESIGGYARRIEVSDGEVLFREGEPAKEMLVVREGHLDVVKNAAGGGEACIARLGPGDVVGEMALIDIQPRSAAVRAHGQAAVIALDAADLASVYREDKQAYTLLVLNISREISLRLRRLDATLANILVELGTVLK